jgi:hypothetical protein
VRVEVARALAAAAAHRTYAIMDSQPEWQNDTSLAWQGHLDGVWTYLSGAREMHYVLSRAIAAFLLSPLNHIEGQDGPDDFDRPQTIAAYSAVTAVVIGVSDVDNANCAVSQIFQALDLEHDTEPRPEWHAACMVERQRVRGWLDLLPGHVQPGAGLSADLLAALQQ